MDCRTLFLSNSTKICVKLISNRPRLGYDSFSNFNRIATRSFFFLRLVIWLTPFHVFLLFHKFSLNNWYSVGFTIPDCSNQTIAVFFVILKNIAFEKRAFFFLKFMKHFFSCIYHFLSFFIQGLCSLFFC